MAKQAEQPKKHMLEVSILKDRMIRERIGAISVHWSVLEWHSLSPPLTLAV